MDKPLWGLRVLKFDGAIAPRVLKFDSGFAAEGGGLPLCGNAYKVSVMEIYFQCHMAC